jgi:hypothetical protein
LIGRSEIQEVHDELFTTRPSRMRLRAMNAHMVDDNTAIVLTKAAVGGEEPLNYDKFQTSLLIRRDGQ